MKKIKVTKKVLTQIENQSMIVSVGVEVQAMDTSLSGDKLTPATLVAFLKSKPQVVLANSNDNYFLVSPKRYDKISGVFTKQKSVPTPTKIVTSSVTPDIVKASPSIRIPKVITIWDKKDDFLAVFPSLKTQFEASLVSISSQSCTGCAANKLRVKLIEKVIDLYLESNGLEIPADTKKYLEPQFSTMLAQAMTENKAPKGSIEKDGVVLVPKMHKHLSTGYRPTCLDCVRKHISQAIILLQEAELPEYKNHFWLGVGHLAEAESESLSSYPELANTIRDHRLAMMTDREYKPNLVDMFEIVDVTENSNG